MSGKPYYRSFAGGEITGEMFGRLDLDKFQTGLANCENFRVLPHGPVENRAGFEYVIRALNAFSSQCRLIPFAFSAEETMVLEFTDLAVRFHTNGGTVLEASKVMFPMMTQADPGVFSVAAHGWSNDDWVYCHSFDGVFALHQQYLIVQNVTANTFTLTDLFGNVIDTTSMTLPVSAVTFARVYTVTTPYLSADLFSLHYTQSADVLTIVHPSYEPRELRRLGATNWVLATITFAPSIAAPVAAPGLAAIGPGGGTPVDQVYVSTAVANESLEESVASPSDLLSRDLTVAGNSIDVTPDAVVGAVRYNIYKQKGGLFGYIGSTDGAALRDDNINPDVTTTPPVSYTPFTGAGNYPSTVTYFEQRRCFAATDNLPQHHWFTRSATESNLSQSIPVRDDDAIIFRIAAAQQNRVRHLVPITDLISLTVGAEWRITPSSGDFLTPAVVPRPQSYVGANNVQPVVTSASVLYIQAQGAHLRELSYGGESSNYGYSSLDASVLAPHLVDYFGIVDLAYSRAPVQSAYPVRSDGVLLGFTYVPEQNVRAWHHHTTQGQFESACCVAEGGEDVLYVVVNRTIGGVGYRYIERQHSRHFEEIADCFFVDSGLTYDGAPATIIRGLWHLEGKSVVALADGAVQPVQTVIDGRITLLQAASKVHVGLAYTATLDTLPVTMETQGFGQGSMKNVSRVHVRVSRSSGLFAGPKGGVLTEFKQRTTEDYGAPPALATMTQSFNVAPQWNNAGQVTIEQRAPLPLTVLSVGLEVSSP